MGGDSTSPSSSSRKRHQMSSEEDGGVEEESKVRDHHHSRHHGHRHHRRSHGKHGREEGEVSQEEAEVLQGERLVVDGGGASVMDVEEREEGEIFDEEDAFSDGAHLPDEITKECAALNVGEVRGELMNHPLADGELKQEACFLRDGKFGHGDEYRMASHDEAAMSKSRSQQEVSQIERENEKEVQSGSHGFRGTELRTKRKREENLDLNGHKEQRHSESWDSYRKSYDNRERSASPESYNEISKTRGQSPSHSKYHDNEKCGHRSRSSSRLRERSYDLDYQTFRAISSDSQDGIRSYSDCERGSLYDKQDKCKRQSQEVDYERDKLYRVERECSASSLGRHNGCEGKHGNLERNRKRERERSRDRKIDKGREIVRDRNRDKDRDHVKIREVGRENERERIRTRERVGDKGRIRDNNDRESSRVRRGRTSHRLCNRDVDRREERDRVRIHNSRVESRCSGYDEPEHYKDNARSKSAKHNHEDLKEKTSTREEDEEYYQEKIEQQLAKQEDDDPKKIIEESRRRREAILEKYKKQQSQKHSEPPTGIEEEEEKTSVAANNNLTVDVPQVVASKGSTSEQNSPDMKFSIGGSPLQNGVIPEKAAGGPGYSSPKSERSADMFCDDIFGESPAGVRVMGKETHLAVERTAAHDNWDDAEGYYSYRLGEVLDGRYEIIAAHGKGVFSTVVRAKDLRAGKDEPEVAIKIIRNNDTMYKAGLEELTILKKIARADPGDKRHCVRFISSFKYRNHLCLVFETLHMNLREVLKKFGRNIGLKLTAVRAYAKQLFIALKHLRSCGVLHCDIKPDNMLVNEAKNVLKLCDFGNAMFAGKNEITPYLVSRFYRSPEIILGLSYDHPMDVWSVGCCLFELYNGKVLFPGPSNNEMLRLHMELKGLFPKKMLRKGAFTDQHFDHDLNFLATEEDPVTKKPVKRLLLNIKPKDMGTILTSFPEEDPKMLSHFKDLLERIFILDPEKRLTVSQALSHPFITGK